MKRGSTTRRASLSAGKPVCTGFRYSSGACWLKAPSFNQMKVGMHALSVSSMHKDGQGVTKGEVRPLVRPVGWSYLENAYADLPAVSDGTQGSRHCQLALPAPTSYGAAACFSRSRRTDARRAASARPALRSVLPTSVSAPHTMYMATLKSTAGGRSSAPPQPGCMASDAACMLRCAALRTGNHVRQHDAEFHNECAAVLPMQCRRRPAGSLACMASAACSDAAR